MTRSWPASSRRRLAASKELAVFDQLCLRLARTRPNEDCSRTRMQQPNQNCDRHGCHHDSHPGGVASDEAPSQRQQDQLCGNRWSSAPPPAKEDSSTDEEEQETESGHQDRHANSHNGARHPDLSELQRRVGQSSQCFDRQEHCRHDDGEWASGP